MSGIEHVVKAGVIRIDCGCSEDRRKRCLQRGPGREDDGRVSDTLNEGCHIFVTEDDLIRMAREITDARFQSTKREENPSLPDIDQPQPVQPRRRKPVKKKARRKK